MIRSYILLLLLAGTSVVMGMDNDDNTAVILAPISEAESKELGEIVVSITTAPVQEMKETQGVTRLEIIDLDQGSVVAPELNDPLRIPLCAAFIGACVGFGYYCSYIVSKYL